MSDNYPVDGELRRQAARIEAMEQAHAELAETVDELRTLMNARYNAQAAMIVNIKDRVALESPAPAPVWEAGDRVQINAPRSKHHGQAGTVQASDGPAVIVEFDEIIARGLSAGYWPDELIAVPTAEPAPLDNDEGMHTLPAKTAAQERYHEANERHYSNREVEMAAGAFDRAEEVAQELDDWTHLIHMRLNTMSQRIASLESPAPAPDPVCAKCGHDKCHHIGFGAFCAASHCECGGWYVEPVPTAEPEPAPLDPGALKVATR